MGVIKIMIVDFITGCFGKMKTYEKFIEIYEGNLPAGFEGFGDDDVNNFTKDKYKGFSSSLKSGSVVKFGKSVWSVIKKEDDANLIVIKKGTKGKKLYKLSNVGYGDYEVWQIGGSGQKIGSRPVEFGKIK